MDVGQQDLWTTRDLPVLRATARMLEEEDIVQAVEVARETGLPRRQVVLALVNLGHRHLVVKDSSDSEGRDVYVTGTTVAGLEAVGYWPTADVAADRLIEALNQLIDAEPAESPKRSRLATIRDGLVGIGRDVLVDVASAVITSRIPSA